MQFLINNTELYYIFKVFVAGDLIQDQFGQNEI